MTWGSLAYKGIVIDDTVVLFTLYLDRVAQRPQKPSGLG